MTEIADSMLHFVRPSLRDLKYHGVESLENISLAVGVPVNKLIKLNANENIYGAPALVLDAIQKVWKNNQWFNGY